MERLARFDRIQQLRQTHRLERRQGILDALEVPRGAFKRSPLLTLSGAIPDRATKSYVFLGTAEPRRRRNQAPDRSRIFRFSATASVRDEQCVRTATGGKPSRRVTVSQALPCGHRSVGVESEPPDPMPAKDAQLPSGRSVFTAAPFDQAGPARCRRGGFDARKAGGSNNDKP